MISELTAEWIRLKEEELKSAQHAPKSKTQLSRFLPRLLTVVSTVSDDTLDRAASPLGGRSGRRCLGPSYGK
ncbi:hypothetical protein [Bradyrhizobium jicamae]|uniref:hypothetical protein n=1 Tax=Bradyrhizobium jicamae TaxID=280332 RepID=UPI001BA9AA44|nr:hypothetical protein [Bradyrhizobium jicamae]MBR0934850.1 hypothetical protein [Bradyrhizobium jicamae]